MSDAMVNIRCTLDAAEASQVISPAVRQALERIAKELFYPDRSYPLILRRGLEQGLPAGELAALRAWLPQGRVDQKRDDALAMLRTMRDRLTADSGPKRADFAFEHTVFWDQVVRVTGELDLDIDGDQDSLTLDALLDE